jgi:hypothetical protein
MVTSWRPSAYTNAAAAFALFAVLGVGAWSARAAPTEVPKVTNLRAEPSRFCARSSSTCAHPGTTVRFSVSTGATVTGNMWPRSENVAGYREFRHHFNAGANSIRLNDNRLTTGRWTVKLQGLNAVGSGTTAVVDVRVVK